MAQVDGLRVQQFCQDLSRLHDARPGTVEILIAKRAGKFFQTSVQNIAGERNFYEIRIGECREPLVRDTS